MSTFAVIFPAAGRSSRFGDPKQKKIYAELDGRAVWLRAVEPFVNRDDVAQMILAIAPEDRELFERRYRASVAFMSIQVIHGGAERHDTVAQALEAVNSSCEFVAIHDAARPCVTGELIDRVFAAAIEHGAALPGLPVADTLKRVDANHTITETVPRAGLFVAQTPQVFQREILLSAYANRSRVQRELTDDAQLVEQIGHACHVVEGSPFNIKITTAADLRLASAILQVLPRPKKDAPAHPFADERAMWDEAGPKPDPKDLFR
jgi:2-C-methyl-D-erythritol 4-phosphate cytidylyltransferase